MSPPKDEQATTGHPAEPVDTSDFAAIYRTHVNHVFHQLTRLAGPIPEREDLVQEVFIRLHRALPTFRGEASLATFIRRLTVNVAYDFFRKRGRRPQELPQLEHGLPDLPDGRPSQAELLHDQRQLQMLLVALDRLSPKKRIAFSLHVFDGLPPAQVAELVGARVPAVRQRIRHATAEVTAHVSKLAARLPK